MTTDKKIETFDLHKFSLNRRKFIKMMGATATVAMLPIHAYAKDDIPVNFTHGVASGDPLANSVIIWSRATSPNSEAFYLYWLIATDPEMKHIVNGGLVKSTAEFDHTLKVDVTGLRADTTYYYQFVYRNHRSPIGTTKTLADGELSHSRLAVVSCANYVKGYFNAYAEIAKMADIDVVIHLGDYFYEYGADGYVTPGNLLADIPQPRLSELQPSHEVVSLDDYRQRYALYRSDEDLQHVHALKPFICVWDDHETANDSWKSGAENHDDDEGAWIARRNAAIQAYYEWLPIREPDSGDRLQSYRSFAFGDLLRLIMLDTRLIGRDQQLSVEQYVGAYQTATAGGSFPLDVNSDGSQRELLGSEQKAWLQNELSEGASSQTWQVIGQQILFQYQTAPDIYNSQALTEEQKQFLLQAIDSQFGEGSGDLFAQIGEAGGPNPIAIDMWTGYPTEKLEISAMLAATPNPIVLAGDSHNAWAANLKLPTQQGILPIGVEMAAPGISSPGYEENLFFLTPEQTASLLMEASQNNPLTDDMVYAQTSLRGFMVLDLTPEKAQGEWYFVSNVFSKEYTLELGQVLSVDVDSKQFLG